MPLHSTLFLPNFCTHLCTLLCAIAHPWVVLHTLTYPCIPLHTLAYSCIVLHTLAYSCIPLHTVSYSCIPLHTLTYCFVLLDTRAYSGVSSGMWWSWLLPSQWPALPLCELCGCCNIRGREHCHVPADCKVSERNVDYRETMLLYKDYNST